MVDLARQAGVFNGDIEDELLSAISEAVVEWFGDGGDLAIYCDGATGDAVARDALARFRSRIAPSS